jgi:hypothetical protein
VRKPDAKISDVAADFRQGIDSLRDKSDLHYTHQCSVCRREHALKFLDVDLPQNREIQCECGRHLYVSLRGLTMTTIAI